MFRIPQHIGKAILRWRHCSGSMEYPFLIAKWWRAGRSSKRKPRAGTTGKSGRYAHTIVTQTCHCCPWLHLTNQNLKSNIFSSLLCSVLLTLVACSWVFPYPHSERLLTSSRPLSFVRALKFLRESILACYKSKVGGPRVLISILPGLSCVTWWANHSSAHVCCEV